MALPDSDKVIQELNRRFAAPLPEFYQRRIIFWYDEDRDFEEKVRSGEIELADAKLIALDETNNFEIKNTNTAISPINSIAFKIIFFIVFFEKWFYNGNGKRGQAS